MLRPALPSYSQALAGSLTLSRYALPMRSNRLLSYISHDPELIGPLSIRQFQPSASIFRSGSTARGMWIVAEGEARVIFPSADWAGSLSRAAVRGELLGLTETLSGLPYNSTLLAVTSCRCINIQRNDLLERLLHDPLLRAELLIVASHRLSSAYFAAGVQL